jgi:hypothetical protein
LLQTTFRSSVSFTHTFAGTPFSLSLNLSHDQNLLTRTINFGAPTLRLSMSRVTPFKSKIQSDKPKWYENIGMTYSFEFKNQLSTYDSTLFRTETVNKFRMGINQTFAVDAPIKVFKYLNITPSFNYQERTYFKGIQKTWNSDTSYVIHPNGAVDTLNGHVVTDTVWRLNSSRIFNVAMSFNTKAVGIFKFNKGYVKAIRHVFTPTVSFSYHPDFSTAVWKYYKPVQSDATGRTALYSVFEPGQDAIYGIPVAGKEGSVSWSLANNLEMKVYDKKDTVNHEKKVGLLDQFSLSGGYNFAADSLRLLPFNLAVVSSKIFNLINLNFNAVFDPYAVDSLNRKINTFQWTKNHQLLRFSTANISASLALHSKPKPAISPADAVPKYIGDYVSYSPDQIYNFDIPWNVNLAYRFNITHGTSANPDTIIKVQSISVQADFNLTAHWKVAVSTGFDITRKQVTLTNLSVIRDLHCWELTFNWTPALPTFNRQQFSIILHPKSATLKDLKVQKKNSLRDL